MHLDRASSRHWFVTCEKAPHCGALWTARGRFRLRAFILCFYRTAFPIQKSGLKSLAFRSQQLPRISPKSYRHNAVPNRFSTSPTNTPRSLSCVKAGTPSAFGEGSHTAAYTPKHRASLLSLHGGLSLISHLGKQKPEEADARLRRVSASSGVAALPGCVTLFVIWQCCCFSLCAQEFLHAQGEGVSLPSAYSACYRAACARLVNLSFL